MFQRSLALLGVALLGATEVHAGMSCGSSVTWGVTQTVGKEMNGLFENDIH